MARKKKGKSRTKDMVSFEATMKKIDSVLTDPRMQNVSWRGVAGVREKLLSIDYEVLRNVVQKIPNINAIINTRIDQILPFCVYTEDDTKPGYCFSMVDGDNGDIVDSEVKQLRMFIDQTGFNDDSQREDDFSDYITMFIRDIYEIDQVATEVQYNRVGEAVGFWALDGATIKRVEKENDFKRGVRFVQEIEQKIYNEYGADSLLFDYQTKRSDIRYRGYGYSKVEQCIDIITTLLFGYRYVQDQLVKDKVPKGFISVMGDVGSEQLDSIRNYWYSAMSGVGGQWAIPILPSGKDGVGIDFKTLGSNNKDMEFHKTMTFLGSIISAVFGMDMAEMGMKSEDSQSLMGENMAPRLKQSADRGIASTLAFIQQHINKLMRKVTTKYHFKFVGLDVDDEDRKSKIQTAQVGVWKTVNEIREEEGKDELDGDENNVVLHPQAVQIYLAGKAAEQQEQMQEEGGDDWQNDAQGNDADDPNDSQGDVQKSLRDRFHNRTLQKALGDEVRVTIR